MEKSDSKTKKPLKPELHFSEYSAYGVDRALKQDLKEKAKVFGLPTQELLFDSDDVVKKEASDDGVEKLAKKFGVKPKAVK